MTFIDLESIDPYSPVDEVTKAVERAATVEGRHALAREHGLPLDDSALASELSGCPYLLDACGDPECMTCSIIACPYCEPLHFDKDGCPACSYAKTLGAPACETWPNPYFPPDAR